MASQSELVVMVTDVPDSPPVFDRLYYMEQVPENAPIVCHNKCIIPLFLGLDNMNEVVV